MFHTENKHRLSQCLGFLITFLKLGLAGASVWPTDLHLWEKYGKKLSLLPGLILTLCPWSLDWTGKRGRLRTTWNQSPGPSGGLNDLEQIFWLIHIDPDWFLMLTSDESWWIFLISHDTVTYFHCKLFHFSMCATLLIVLLHVSGRRDFSCLNKDDKIFNKWMTGLVFMFTFLLICGCTHVFVFKSSAGHYIWRMFDVLLI